MFTVFTSLDAVRVVVAVVVDVVPLLQILVVALGVAVQESPSLNTQWMLLLAKLYRSSSVPEELEEQLRQIPVERLEVQEAPQVLVIICNFPAEAVEVAAAVPVEMQEVWPGQVIRPGLWALMVLRLVRVAVVRELPGLLVEGVARCVHQLEEVRQDIQAVCHGVMGLAAEAAQLE